jgi:hypothetical protein
VLQAKYHEALIRHAAIALGSLHKRFSLGNASLSDIDGKGKDGNFPL